jgi:hypothetical protein
VNKSAYWVVVVAAASVGAYQASNWWERAFATLQSSEVSPDGCIRVDTYSPFWVLPSFLHRIPDPSPEAPAYPLGMLWDYPMFKRAYEVSTNTFLGETVVYDAGSVGGIYWNKPNDSGRRIVKSGGFFLVDSDRCADEATLSKLDAYYEQKRREYPARMKEWDEYERQWREEERKREEEENLLRIGPPTGAGK